MRNNNNNNNNLDHLHKNAGDVAIFKRKQRIFLSFNKLVRLLALWLAIINTLDEYEEQVSSTVSGNSFKASCAAD